MSERRRNGLARVSLLLLGLLAGNLNAQTFTATLNGRVVDTSGGTVAGAKVTIRNVATNQEKTVTTGTDGNFVLPLLPPGEYALTVEAAGFKRDVRTGITLQVGQQAGLEVNLSVGEMTTVTEVNADVPLVQSENASLGNVVDQKKVVELPLNGRDYLQLAQLQPNVFAPAQGSTLGFRGGLNVAGNSEVANNYTLDGVDNNDETTNQPLHRPILDAVQEFRVVTGTYAAEYGRQAGGQIIVSTKSGTNQLHGSGFEFHRNSIFDAQNFFAPNKPEFTRNQFGGVIGGPIRHDRTFFFAGYEGQRRGQQEAGLAKVPTAAMKRGDFSALLANPDPAKRTYLRDPERSGPCNASIQTACFPGNQVPTTRSPQGAGLLALYPDPNRAGPNNFVSAAASPFRLDQFSVRVDHKLTDKDNIFGVYEFADSNEFFAIANPLCSARDVPGWGCTELQRTQSAAIVWTRTLTTHLVNEARIGYSRFGFFRLQQDRDQDVISRLGIGGLTDAGAPGHPFNNGAPQLSVSGISTIGGPTNLPQGRHDNTYHYVENMTLIHNSHTMKWGLDIRRFLFNSFFTSFGRGSFNFQGTFTGNAVADLLLGLPRQADRNIGEPFHNAMTFSSGYYFQDDWKITPKLTLNLGLRYELNLPPIEKVNKMASFDPTTGTIKVAGGFEALPISDTSVPGFYLLLRSRPDVGRRLWKTDWNNFAPRVGVAWRPFGGNRTVIRTGYGLFYNYQIVGNGITPLSRNSPVRQRQTAGPIAKGAAPTLSLANAFTGSPSVVAPGIDPNFVTAYVNQWSLGVQREVVKDLVLDVSYLGSESHKLPVGVNINQAIPGPGSIASRRPYKGYGNITGGYISSIGNSNYHALQARLERRLPKGLSLVSSYTWSKAIDSDSGISTGSDSSGSAQNARNLQAERSASDYDTRHRWVFSYVYDLPFGSGRRYSPSNRFAGALVGGWQLTGILTLQTGRPFTVYVGQDNSSTAGNNDRPNLIGDWRVPNPSTDRWFNTCTLLAAGTPVNCSAGQSPAWQIPASGTFGNVGRNTLRGDGLRNFDLGLYRAFKITERQGLQFRAEIFNLTNHPNFYFPGATVLSDPTTGNSSFGTITRAAFQAQTGAQRQIQLALKYVF
jgi:hypothetical protein